MPFKDKLEQKESSRRHYEANREKVIARSNAARKLRNIEFKRIISEYLSIHPCVDCGEKDLIVLEFDHVRGEKKFNIADSYWTVSSTKKLTDEMNKCEVRCANCHRRKTHERRVAANK